MISNGIVILVISGLYCTNAALNCSNLGHELRSASENSNTWLSEAAKCLNWSTFVAEAIAGHHRLDPVLVEDLIQFSLGNNNSTEEDLGAILQEMTNKNYLPDTSTWDVILDDSLQSSRYTHLNLSGFRPSPIVSRENNMLHGTYKIKDMD